MCELAGEEHGQLLKMILEDIYIHEFREVSEIWNLIPPERWQTYDNAGIEDLREQLLLKAALENLRNIFIFKVVSRVKSKKAREEAAAEDLD